MPVRLLSITVLVVSVSSIHAAERPNVLYIMSDDHAAHAISAYGSRLAQVAPTPNIDRLAKEGALFTNAFCTNSICSPSRACVLTGQYNHVNGAFDLSGRVLPGKQMLAIEMGKAGYHTAIVSQSTFRVRRAKATVTNDNAPAMNEIARARRHIDVRQRRLFLETLVIASSGLFRAPGKREGRVGIFERQELLAA